MALLVGAVAVYGHWAAWVGIVLRDAGLDVMGLDVALQPGTMWGMILEINEVGAWSIFGVQLSGIPLWGVWLIEAGIVLGVGVIASRAMYLDLPFCEECKSWCKKHSNVARVWHEDTGTVAKAFENKDFNALRSFKPIALDLEVGIWFECDVETCPSCSATSTLDVSSVAGTTNEKGEASTDTTEIVSNLLLTKEEVQAIRSLGDARGQDADS